MTVSFFHPGSSVLSARNVKPNTLGQHPEKEYTDQDFAKDMQALTFQERTFVMDDIHLVAGRTDETEDFIAKKTQAVIQVLANHSRKRVQRAAWDRAVFLRPLLAVDKEHYMTFLRAKSYDPYDAAMLLLKFYEMKAKVWGDEYLARRPCWNDLSEATRATYHKAHSLFLKYNREMPCRRAWYLRVSSIANDPEFDYMEFLRATSYPFFSNMFGKTKLQQKGMVAIIDLRGPMPMTPLKLLEHAQVLIPMMET